MARNLTISNHVYDRLTECKCCGASYSDVIEMLFEKSPDINVILENLKANQDRRENSCKKA